MKTQAASKRPPKEWQDKLYDYAYNVAFIEHDNRLRKRLDRYYKTNLSLYLRNLREGLIGWVSFFRLCEALELDCFVEFEHELTKLDN